MKKQITKFGWLIIAVTMMAFAPKEAEAQTGAEAQTVSTQEPPKDGDYYQISTKEHLYWFAKHVNDGNNTACAKLTDNIEVNSGLLTGKIDENGNVKGGAIVYKWIPIGHGSDSRGNAIQFKGTFDGGNHTISGLYFCDNSKDNVGLIGTAGSGAEIKDVIVKDSYFKGRFQVGGVCGHNYGTILNCNNTGKVSGYLNVGGVCGGKSNISTIQYKRTGLTNGSYGTICMPYGVKAGDRIGAKFYSIAGKTTDGGKVTAIYLEEVTGDLAAGQPYIFRATAEEMTCKCSTDDEQDAQTVNGLVGTYQGIRRARG